MTTSSKRRSRSGPGIGFGFHAGRDGQHVVEGTFARQHVHREGEALLDLAEPPRGLLVEPCRGEQRGADLLGRAELELASLGGGLHRRDPGAVEIAGGDVPRDRSR